MGWLLRVFGRGAATVKLNTLGFHLKRPSMFIWSKTRLLVDSIWGRVHGRGAFDGKENQIKPPQIHDLASSEEVVLVGESKWVEENVLYQKKKCGMRHITNLLDLTLEHVGGRIRIVKSPC